MRFAHENEFLAQRRSRTAKGKREIISRDILRTNYHANSTIVGFAWIRAIRCFILNCTLRAKID